MDNIETDIVTSLNMKSVCFTYLGHLWGELHERQTNKQNTNTEIK